MAKQPENNPAREQIEQRAFEIYLQRGGVDGSDVEDWLMAEEQLKLALAPKEATRSTAKGAGQK